MQLAAFMKLFNLSNNLCFKFRQRLTQIINAKRITFQSCKFLYKFHAMLCIKQMSTTARDWRGPASTAAQQWTRASRASVGAQPAIRENTVKQVRKELHKTSFYVTVCSVVRDINTSLLLFRH